MTKRNKYYIVLAVNNLNNEVSLTSSKIILTKKWQLKSVDICSIDNRKRQNLKFLTAWREYACRHFSVMHIL